MSPSPRNEGEFSPRRLRTNIIAYSLSTRDLDNLQNTMRMPAMQLILDGSYIELSSVVVVNCGVRDNPLSHPTSHTLFSKNSTAFAIHSMTALI